MALTEKNQYIVTPDNGTLTYIKTDVGIKAIREISEVKNRRQNTEYSYTFHGRDVYAYTGAKLASGHITFEEVGPELPVDAVLELPVVEMVIGEILFVELWISWMCVLGLCGHLSNVKISTP